MQKLELQPNVPQLIALKYPQGKIVPSNFGSDKQQVQFFLLDGRIYYASLGVAQKINELQLREHEEFYICKKVTGKAQFGYIDVWLRRGETPATPTPAPEPPSLLERQLAASIHEAQARKAAAMAPIPPPAAAPPQTGTYGPVAVPKQQPQQMPASWQQNLLMQTNQLIEVYAEACKHAEQHGVPNAVVRTVMLSAFIGLQRKGNY